MAEQQQSIYSTGASAISTKSFPPEFKRTMASRFDGRFVTIFLIIFIVSTLILVIGITQKKDETVSQKDIIKIQERYAQLVLNQPKPKPLPVKEAPVKKVETTETEKPTETQSTEKVAPKENETYVEKQARKEATSVNRQQKREEVARQVSSTGIFAAITSVGAGSGGSRSSGVADLLGADAEAIGDIGSVKISKGSFASRGEDAQTILQSRGSGTGIGAVGIEKSNVGRVGSTRIASSGAINISSAPPEIVSGQSSNPDRSQSSIQAVVNKLSSQLKRVYEDWLKRDPQLSGKLQIKFTIIPSGSVINVSVAKSTTGNDEFDQAIVRYIKRWSFPAVTGNENVEIVYPFDFSGS